MSEEEVDKRTGFRFPPPPEKILNPLADDAVPEYAKRYIESSNQAIEEYAHRLWDEKEKRAQFQFRLKRERTVFILIILILLLVFVVIL